MSLYPTHGLNSEFNRNRDYRIAVIVVQTLFHISVCFPPSLSFRASPSSQCHMLTFIDQAF